MIGLGVFVIEPAVSVVGTEVFVVAVVDSVVAVGPAVVGGASVADTAAC